MQHDSGKGVHHGSSGSDWQNVTRHFDGALVCLFLDLIDPLGMRKRAGDFVFEYFAHGQQYRFYDGSENGDVAKWFRLHLAVHVALEIDGAFVVQAGARHMNLKVSGLDDAIGDEECGGTLARAAVAQVMLRRDQVQHR